MLASDAVITRGAQAEQARDYVNTLIRETRELLLDRLINLNPDQTLLFTIYKAQLQCLLDVPAVVEADILAGREAIDIMQGAPVAPGGIL